MINDKKERKRVCVNEEIRFYVDRYNKEKGTNYQPLLQPQGSRQYKRVSRLGAKYAPRKMPLHSVEGSLV